MRENRAGRLSDFHCDVRAKRLHLALEGPCSSCYTLFINGCVTVNTSGLHGRRIHRRNSLTARNRSVIRSSSSSSTSLSRSFRSPPPFPSLGSVSIAFNLELPRYRITLRSTRLLEVLEILGESHYEFHGSTGTCANTRCWCNCPARSLDALLFTGIYGFSLACPLWPPWLDIRLSRYNCTDNYLP